MHSSVTSLRPYSAGWDFRYPVTLPTSESSRAKILNHARRPQTGKLG